MIASDNIPIIGLRFDDTLYDNMRRFTSWVGNTTSLATDPGIDYPVNFAGDSISSVNKILATVVGHTLNHWIRASALL